MSDVQIVEVSARDGLQNDPAILDTATKVELVSRCLRAGLLRQEIASFVNPARVPRMADAEAVVEGVRGLDAPEAASWIGLVLNARGFERARLTGVDEVNLVVSASDGFAKANQGMTSDQTAAVVEEVAPLALAAGVEPTVTISTSFGCPFDGEVDPGYVADLAARLAGAGVTEIALADTIGVGVPRQVRDLVDRVSGLGSGTASASASGSPSIRLRAHFHNTRNTGYANALAAYESGVRVLDSSLGGIGGCPFAPKATGNIATEDLVFLLERSGISTGVDLDALIVAGEWLGEQLGRPTPSLVSKAGRF